MMHPDRRIPENLDALIGQGMVEHPILLGIIMSRERSGVLENNFFIGDIACGAVFDLPLWPPGDELSKLAR